MGDTRGDTVAKVMFFGGLFGLPSLWIVNIMYFWVIVYGRLPCCTHVTPRPLNLFTLHVSYDLYSVNYPTILMRQDSTTSFTRSISDSYQILGRLFLHME